MPVTTSYPGVYIEETSSGMQPIGGVATAIAAFVGWASKGCIDRPELVRSFAEFTRKCGGLDPRSLLGYSVSHFFANGGQQAWIVRLATGGASAAADNATTAQATIDGKLLLTASSPGAWANNYAIATRLAADPRRFRLAVLQIKSDGTGVAVEVFDNLSMNPGDARNVFDILRIESAFVGAAPIGDPAGPPADTVLSAAGVIPAANPLTGGADGKVLAPNDPAFETALLPANETGGVYWLDETDRFNLLCVPGESNASVLRDLEKFCRDRRALLIADCAADASVVSLQNGPDTSLTGNDALNAALYFPWVLAADPLQANQARSFAPCGFVAGIFARIDSKHGVWKTPAGTEATIAGATGVATAISDPQNDALNAKAVNCIRSLPGSSTVVWGGRTLQGSDAQNSDLKYVAVRRMALFLEQSIDSGLKWAAFEPNGGPLWAQIRSNAGAFLQGLFVQGAFQGTTPQQAYFVKCDSDTTTQTDIGAGVVNIIAGFAPLKPAEFVIVTLQQMAAKPYPP